MTGQYHYPEVDLTTPIDDLFNYVFSGFRVPKEDCTLMSTGKHLVLDKTLEEQGIGEMSTIRMNVRQRGGNNDENEDEIDKIIKRLILDDNERGCEICFPFVSLRCLRYVHVLIICLMYVF